ncbi:hypothetical protein DYB31_014112 [Aphanomyces astaci]|uniref:Retrotransposon gag domain-containing protein n=1 Tax=Aphanomyces astaci TaxID=112090 RepID=A0A397EKI5_APHAT|nr:hypothetical protein DYB31_014112 [Aphanomyces astaci]
MEDLPSTNCFVGLSKLVVPRMFRTSMTMRSASFAMSHLTGRADNWAWGLTCEDGFAFANFDDFIEQLKAVFLPANSDFRYRTEYLSARQGKRSIRKYVHDLRFLASCVTQKSSLFEETKVTIFMNGLNDSAARTQLFRTYHSTFEDAVRTALAEDSPIAHHYQDPRPT